MDLPEQCSISMDKGTLKFKTGSLKGKQVYSPRRVPKHFGSADSQGGQNRVTGYQPSCYWNMIHCRQGGAPQCTTMRCYTIQYMGWNNVVCAVVMQMSVTHNANPWGKVWLEVVDKQAAPKEPCGHLPGSLFNLTHTYVFNTYCHTMIHMCVWHVRGYSLPNCIVCIKLRWVAWVGLGKILLVAFIL